MAVGQPPSSVPSNVPLATTPENEITIVSHSNLFYWWPVWALAFLLAGLTWLDGTVTAVVPKGSEAVRDAKVEYATPDGKNITAGPVDVIVVPSDPKHPHHLPPSHKVNDVLPDPDQPHLRVSTNKSFGVLFLFTLLLVILITNVPLRGMWSVVVIILIVMLSIIFALAEWWETIIRALGQLDIRINFGGYFLIGAGLFGVWLLTFAFFDRQVYMVFSPRQLKVNTEIGGGQQVYDATGMAVEKRRSDLFRHWVLGLGSGDLVVKTSGAQAHQFELQNVLFVGKKVAQIEDIMKMSVVEAR
jgi:hypothetical protein